MQLTPNETSRKTPKIDTGNLKPLRYYKHTKSNTVYFVHGFCIREDNLETQVIYTNGYLGLPFIRPVKEFESRFTLIEKK